MQPVGEPENTNVSDARENEFVELESISEYSSSSNTSTSDEDFDVTKLMKLNLENLQEHQNPNHLKIMSHICVQIIIVVILLVSRKLLGVQILSSGNKL